MSAPLEFVGLGEALIDIFEDGSYSLGGAPLNAAVHAHRLLAALGLGRGIVVSALGDDKWGEQARSVLTSIPMTTDFIATSKQPTGTASVFTHQGDAGFEIAQDVAWDHIPFTPATDALASRCRAVCFGSLAQRAPESRETIRAFLRRAQNSWRLYDVNLRRSTLSGRADYSREIVESSCRLASALKANENEILELAAMFAISPASVATEAGANTHAHAGPVPAEDSLWPRMELFLKEFALEAVIVTRAERPALAATREGQFTAQPAPVPTGEVHPVGAGDAFSAGILFARSQNWPWARALDLATRLGAFVTKHQSAIPPLPPEILALARPK
jgi:fructokinase